jgi:hypothetical protein
LGHYSGLQVAGGEGMKLVAGKGGWMHRYNPKTRNVRT